MSYLLIQNDDVDLIHSKKKVDPTKTNDSIDPTHFKDFKMIEGTN